MSIIQEGDTSRKLVEPSGNFMMPTTKEGLENAKNAFLAKALNGKPNALTQAEIEGRVQSREEG